MFGYIVPFIPELRVRELETYRAHYCGLCRALKARYGKISILNYDAAFVYLLLASLTEEEPDQKKEKCILHPAAGRVTVSAPPQDYASDINVLMAYAKARDDRTDEGGMGAALRYGAVKGAYRKAQMNAPAACRYMEEGQQAIDRLEKGTQTDIDAAGDAYAVLFGNVLADGYVLKSHILYDLGYQLGRWVYLLDALDDMEEDERKGRFNVFVNRAAQRRQTAAKVREDARFPLFYTLAQAAEALGRLEPVRNRALLENILYLGLRRQTENVIAGKGRLDESLRSARRI